MIPRLLLGSQIVKVKDKKYYFDAATSVERLESDLYYNQVMEDNKFSGIPYKAELLARCIQEKKLDADYESKIKTYNKSVENLKVELFHCAFNKKKEAEIRKRLVQLKAAQASYISWVAYLESFSLEGLANAQKARFILTKTCKDERGVKIFDGSINNFLFTEISSKISENIYSENELRAFARSATWRSMWKNCKYQNFKNDFLNEEQKTLVYYSQFYDFVFEHPSRPNDTVIDDDDKLDGWQTHIYKEMQAEKKEQEVDRLVGGQANRWQETFLPASTQEEANEIYSMNSAESQRIIKDRQNLIKNKGKVKEIEFQDNQSKILNQGNEQFKGKFKK